MIRILKISGLTIILAFVITCKKSDPAIPTITTREVFSIEQKTATSGGSILSDGGASITARGVCWGTLPEPTTALTTKTLDGTGKGVFLSTLTGLIPSTTYFVRAYASNIVGTVYGSQVSFTTSFNTVTIGTQTWMAENLKTTKYNDGTKIPLVTDNTAWLNLATPGFCWYNNDSTTFKNLDGAIYNWYTVNTGKLCPLGWHVPTDAEWSTLTTYLGGESIAGAKLKEAGTDYWSSPNPGVTNETGFTALLAGWRYFDGDYVRAFNSFWWSSTESSATEAWQRGMYAGWKSVGRVKGDKRNGSSVRCVKNF